MPQLSDTQLILLSSAAQRDDHLLIPPEHLKGQAREKIASALLTRAFVQKTAVSRGQPYWWEAEDSAHLIGLSITVAGLEAIGIEEGESPGAEEPGSHLPDARASAPDSPTPQIGEPASDRAPQGVGQPSSPREGSKQALVLSLLSRPEGALMDDLLRATGWLPHTTRAALTGLRQKGYAITRTKEAGGESVYRIVLCALGQESCPDAGALRQAHGTAFAEQCA